MSALERLRAESNRCYLRWVLNGSHEADDSLNDGNRSVIRKYFTEYSNPLGYKFYIGVIRLDTSKLTNFCCDYVFNGTAENIKKIETAEKEFRKTGLPEPLMFALDEAEGICLYWS